MKSEMKGNKYLGVKVKGLHLYCDVIILCHVTEAVGVQLSPHRDMDVSLDQDVEDGKGEVSGELPDLPSQQHPQDPVRGVNPDPAPAHRHLRSVVADLAQRHGGDSDG